MGYDKPLACYGGYSRFILGTQNNAFMLPKRQGNVETHAARAQN